MKIIGVREAKDRFTTICRNLKGEPAIVTKNGRKYVAIVALTDDIDLEIFLMANNAKLRRMLNQAKKGPFISGADVRNRIEENIQRRNRKAA